MTNDDSAHSYGHVIADTDQLWVGGLYQRGQAYGHIVPDHNTSHAMKPHPRSRISGNIQSYQLKDAILESVPE